MSILTPPSVRREAGAAPGRVHAAGSIPERRRQRARTVLPDTEGVPVAARRQLRGIRIEDRFNIVGAAAASCAITALVFGWFTPLTGVIGAVVVAYLAFIGFYAILVSLRAGRQEVADRVATVVLASAGIVLVGALLFVVLFTLLRGREALTHLNFFTESMELAGPLDPLSVGGIVHAILGTFIQIGIALAITIPLGLATAVFLNEVGGPFARFVRTIVDAMTALPSIVAGLFVYAAVIVLVTHQRSGFAAAVAITVMMLPIVIRASDVVLRLVAGNLREASAALGATRWRTVWHVVLPTARTGLVTAVILGTARGIGETSPVLLTSGITAVVNLNPFAGPMISLPLQVFDFVRSPEQNMVARGFGTAAVLLIVVLGLFAVARMIGGKAPGQLSPRQRRAVADASFSDLRRMTARASQNPAAASSTPTPQTQESP